MTLDQIKQFLEIVKEGTIGKASVTLNMSQPNLSISMKKLEDELGKQLFIRTKKGLILTDFGNDFIAYADSLYKDYKNLKVFCDGRKNQTIYLNVSITPQTWLAKALGRVINSLENNILKCNFLNSVSYSEMIQNVKTGKSEIAFPVLSFGYEKSILQQIESEGLEYHSLGKEYFTAIVNNKHPFIKKGLASVTIDMIRDYPVVTIGEERAQTEKYLSEYEGIATTLESSLIAVSNGNTMSGILSQSNAVGLTMHLNKAYSNISYREGLTALPITNFPASFDAGWICLKDRELSVGAKELIKQVNKICNINAS